MYKTIKINDVWKYPFGTEVFVPHEYCEEIGFVTEREQEPFIFADKDFELGFLLIHDTGFQVWCDKEENEMDVRIPTHPDLEELVDNYLRAAGMYYMALIEDGGNASDLTSLLDSIARVAELRDLIKEENADSI